MSSRSVLVQQKLKDDQFLGDLINLFERRKIKTGDPSSLETFDTVLASNDAFRSQLFTLCTAISHMSAEDLSGEQLLVLVARALGGAEICQNGAGADIPDKMRSAFLTGYDAWTNRTFEPKEPLPWPNPSQPEQRDEPSQLVNAEPAASRPPSPGMRTVQEALGIARERTLANRAAHPASLDANTEGLTLAELKALLAEIENRVSRIQPHLNDLTSVAHSPADLFGRRATIHEIDPTHPLNTALPAAGTETSPANPPEDAAASLPAADHRASRPSRLNEAAFLARHAYLRPSRRVGAEPHATGSAAASAAARLAVPPAPISPGPLLAVAPATPVAPVPEFVATAVPASPEPSQATVIPIFAPPIAVVPDAPLVAPQPAAAKIAAALSEAAATPRLEPIPYVPDEPASLSIGRLKVTPLMAIGSLTLVAALIVVISGLAGLFIYPSLHPKTIKDFPDLNPPAQSDRQGSAAPADAASGAQVILAAPGDPSMAPQTSHAGTAPSKPRAKAPEPPPSAAVWPYTNQVTIRDAVAPPSAPSVPAHRIVPQAPPLYVPSTTLIAYALSAPQPSYPKDQPRGINGTVVVQITVSPEGYVTEIRVVSGPVEMRPATVQAVQAWRFKPYLVNGTPAAVTTTLGFLFRGQ